MKNTKKVVLGLIMISVLALAGCGNYKVAGKWACGNSEVGFDPTKDVCGLAVADEPLSIICAGSYEVKDGYLNIAITQEATDSFYEKSVKEKMTKMTKDTLSASLKKSPYTKEQAFALSQSENPVEAKQGAELYGMYILVEDEKKLEAYVDGQAKIVMDKWIAKKNVSFPFEREGATLKITFPKKETGLTDKTLTFEVKK